MPEDLESTAANIQIMKPYHQKIYVGAEVKDIENDPNSGREIRCYSYKELDWENPNNLPADIFEVELSLADVKNKMLKPYLYTQKGQYIKTASNAPDLLDVYNQQQPLHKAAHFEQKITNIVQDKNFIPIYTKQQKRDVWQNYYVGHPEFESNPVNAGVIAFVRENKLDIQMALESNYQNHKKGITVFVPNIGVNSVDKLEPVYITKEILPKTPHHKTALAVIAGLRDGFDRLILNPQNAQDFQMFECLNKQMPHVKKLFSANKINTVNQLATSTFPAHAGPEVG